MSGRCHSVGMPLSTVTALCPASTTAMLLFGTLITDNLTDRFSVSLVLSTAVFTVLLAATFAAWFRSERTLSIHTIVTTRREGFYWLAILFTFALGTAAGDLFAEHLSLGLDCRILLLTCRRLVDRKGVLPGAGAELDEFWGTLGVPETGPRAYPVETDEETRA